MPWIPGYTAASPSCASTLTTLDAAIHGDRERGAADGVEAYLVSAVDAEIVVGGHDVHEVRPWRGTRSYHTSHQPEFVEQSDLSESPPGYGKKEARR